jgi:hypothetical protein
VLVLATAVVVLECDATEVVAVVGCVVVEVEGWVTDVEGLPVEVVCTPPVVVDGLDEPLVAT